MAAYEEQEYNKPFDIKVWTRLFPFIRPYRKQLIVTMSLNVVMALLDIVFPFFQSHAIDRFIVPETTEGILPFGLFYVGLILLQGLCVFVSVHAASAIEMNIGKDMKRAEFEHLQRLSFSYYNTTAVGYIHARVMSDTNRISQLIAWGLTDLLWCSIYVIFVFVVMFVLNWKLALIIAVIVPFVVLLTNFFQNRMLGWNRKVRKINSQITGAYNEGITGVRTTKTLVGEKANDRAFEELTDRMHHSSVSVARMNAVFIPSIMFFGYIAAAIVLARGGKLVQMDLMKLGTLSVFISYALNIFEPVQGIAAIMADVISCQANIERVTDLLDQQPGIVDSPEVREKYGDTFAPKRENWEPVQGHITFEDVSFKYPDGKEYVLEHFNLDVPAGSNVAIVGETGAGKSTLVNLACRFYEPTSGRILIDGVDYRERSELWLHSQIGYVLQNPHLFSGTIRDNIRYGRLEATDEEVEAAARQVSADEVAAHLKDGYDSDVGEGGGLLSTGEKQLVSFARAILAKPAIFVLDEATSSIDTRTEQLIQKATNEVLKNHTAFVIAHRLSTIRQADLILVVQDGKIIERGTHRELLRKKGYYYELYSRQFEEEEARKVYA